MLGWLRVWMGGREAEGRQAGKGRGGCAMGRRTTCPHGAHGPRIPPPASQPASPTGRQARGRRSSSSPPVVSTSSTPGFSTFITTSLLLPRRTAACTCGAQVRDAGGAGLEAGRGRAHGRGSGTRRARHRQRCTANRPAHPNPGALSGGGPINWQPWQACTTTHAPPHHHQPHLRNGGCGQRLRVHAGKHIFQPQPQLALNRPPAGWPTVYSACQA